MRRAILLAAAVAAVGLSVGATPAQAQLFGPRYRMRIERDGDIVVRGRGYAPVVVDPYVVPTSAVYVTGSPVVATSMYVPTVATSMYVPTVATSMYVPTVATRVYEPTIISRPVPTVSVLSSPVVTRSYVTTSGVVATPVYGTRYIQAFPTQAIAYPWP